MNFKLKYNGKDYDVDISEEKGGNGNVRIKIGSKDFVFEQKERTEKIIAPRVSLPRKTFSSKEIKAPIAGVISGVFVKEGDLIKNGQKLVTLSAMKMENEIVSDFEGKVEKVFVKKDQKVSESEVLAVLK